MKHIFLFLTLAAFFSACANIGQLSGGERDITPPKVDSTHSTPFLQTNFKVQPIELTFNEWVKLDKPESQIIVSPPLEYPITTKLHGHTLLLTFDKREVLRPDATYTVNFGTAVKDLTESNPAADLRFVFSTGLAIDSLSVLATINDAQVGTPVADALLMLYDNVADTVVRKTKPFYFGKTDKSGVVNIQNIRAGTYRVFALLDGNADYRYNADTELIGFPEGFLTVTDSTSPAKLKISMAEGFVPLKQLESNIKTYGVFRILYNRSPIDASIITEGIDAPFWHDIKGDTLQFWYAATTPFTLFVRHDETSTDTFKITPLDDATWRTNARLLQKDLFSIPANFKGKATPTGAALAATQHPDEPYSMTFNHPLNAVDISKLKLLEEVARDEKDTSRVMVEPSFVPVDAVYSIDSMDKFRLLTRYKWAENRIYKLIVAPEGVIDIYGLKNIDTLSISCKTLVRQTLGDVQLKVTHLDSTKNYVVDLMQGELVVRTHLVNAGSADVSFTFEALPVGSYNIRMIEDNNKNARWDGPNYDRQQQPEKQIFKNVGALRANWAQEVIVDWLVGGDSSGSKKGKKGGKE